MVGIRSGRVFCVRLVNSRGSKRVLLASRKWVLMGTTGSTTAGSAGGGVSNKAVTKTTKRSAPGTSTSSAPGTSTSSVSGRLQPTHHRSIGSPSALKKTHRNYNYMAVDEDGVRTEQGRQGVVWKRRESD